VRGGRRAPDSDPGAPLYLPVDLDVLDPATMPCLRSPRRRRAAPDPLAVTLRRLLDTAGRHPGPHLPPGQHAADHLRGHLAVLLAGRQPGPGVSRLW
jgi:hypothetical protein